MRLIDAEHLKRWIMLRLESGVSVGYDDVNTYEILEQIDRELTINPEPRWIPCTTETMPEEGEEVLCTHLGGLNPSRQVIKHIYQNGKFVLGWDMDMNPSSPTFGQRYMGKVIAWMPLPKPYMREGEAE